MKKKTVGQIVLLIVLAVLALACLLPMLLVLADAKGGECLHESTDRR